MSCFSSRSGLRSSPSDSVSAESRSVFCEGAGSPRLSAERITTWGLVVEAAAQSRFMTASRSAMVSGAAVISSSPVSGRSGRSSGRTLQRSSSAAMRSRIRGFGWVIHSRALWSLACRACAQRAVTKARAELSTGSKAAVVCPRTNVSSRFLKGGEACALAIPGRSPDGWHGVFAGTGWRCIDCAGRKGKSHEGEGGEGDLFRV